MSENSDLREICEKTEKFLSKCYSKVKDFLVRYKFISVLIFVVATTIPLFLIFILDNLGVKKYIFKNSLITASDMLGFYVGFLAFLGTVSLGALALWQNHMFNIKEVNREQEVNREKNQPKLTLGFNGNAITVQNDGKQMKDLDIQKIFFCYKDSEKAFTAYCRSGIKHLMVGYGELKDEEIAEGIKDLIAKGNYTILRFLLSVKDFECENTYYYLHTCEVKENNILEEIGRVEYSLEDFLYLKEDREHYDANR